jgi:predicted SAM-dependent methyltransferase
MMPRGKLKIVDLGCGPNKIQTQDGTVVGVDIRDLPGVDYRCDLRKLPFGTHQFDVVYSSHTLEHFSRDEISSVLDEWTRVLKQRGELRLVIPNIAWAAEQIMKGVVDHNVMNVLWGQQEYDQNFHKCGFTPETLKKLLEGKGFGRQAVKLDGYNILFQAWRGKAKKKKQPKKQLKKVSK